MWAAAFTVLYVILFVASGSWHVFLVGNPILPVRVGDCVIQRTTVCQDANLEQAQLARAALRGSNLLKVNLSGSNLWHADLRGANLTDANLSWANLRYTNLREAILIDANLSGANLIGADMREADMRGAYLHGANLSGAILGSAKLRGAKYDIFTIWPEGFDLQGETMVMEE